MSFVSSVTFDLSLEDLIQGLGDTSWVLVEGWEAGTSGRVKSQLPSLGLGHIWGATYIPSSLWKQAVASLSMTCMISDPDWFHPFSCHASPETSLVSLGEFLFFLAVLGLHCIEGNGTPLLPGNSHERRSLEGCSAWGRWGSNKTEQLHFHFHSLEKEMATHSTVLAWRIPAMAEPGGLPSMGTHRVGDDWSDLPAVAGLHCCSGLLYFQRAGAPL